MLMKRWNGWGYERTEYPLPDLAKEYLTNFLGAGARIPDASFEDVLGSVPTSRLPNHPLISTNPGDRIRHACGQSLPDWLALRSGRIPSFPDGVIYPTSDAEIREVIEFAHSNQFILIPYGGGTSVLRHINPPLGDMPTITIDLSELNQLLELDNTSQVASFGAGTRGSDIERQLNKHGFTLGHFPQSFEFSTLGGWIVTRSSGQQSYYYGRIEDLFMGGHIETPQGPMDIPHYPASAAGPDLKQLVLGSEGRLGIISRASVTVRPIPEFEGFYGIFFRDWESGLSAVKEMAQSKFPLSMMRLSDAQETETTLVLSGKGNLVHWAKIGLEEIGYREKRCLLIVGITGDKVRSTQTRKLTLRTCRKYGGLYTGTFIGKTWQKSRFLAPYLRNSLWEAGYALDTLESATSWKNIQSLKDKTISAIIDASHALDEEVLVFGHLSHVYHTGASIYITYIFRRFSDPDQNLHHWQEMKNAASKAIVSSGGTISHQHGVGRDHASYIESEKGHLGLELITAMSKSFDPDGLLNPGVLFPTDGQ
jgi:alkyldihydroxyacetonephosphate synthase